MTQSPPACAFCHDVRSFVTRDAVVPCPHCGADRSRPVDFDISAFVMTALVAVVAIVAAAAFIRIW